MPVAPWARRISSTEAMSRWVIPNSSVMRLNSGALRSSSNAAISVWIEPSTRRPPATEAASVASRSTSSWRCEVNSKSAFRWKYWNSSNVTTQPSRASRAMSCASVRRSVGRGPGTAKSS